ncbi:MAG: hypothetical protein ACODAQ_11570 [Phycisphaeraceae bacterium]
MSESPNPSETEPSYEGHAPPVDTPEQRRRAVEIAFDYRGDVTIDLHDGRSIEGFVYDRQERPGQGLVVRVMPTDGSDRLTLPADQIARLVCSGKDPAAGRSFETWIKKYAEKKMRGEQANFEPGEEQRNVE